MNDLTKGSPAKLILLFTVPILIGNLLQLTYSIADTRIVGSFLGESALAAVGATSIINTLIIGFLNGASNGFAITTAQKFGAGDEDGVRHSFAVALVLGLLISVLITAGGMIFIQPILGFLNVPAELFTTAKQYIIIIIAGTIITMFYDILMAIMRGIGDSRTPLYFLTLSVGLNIFGDLFLIGVMHTGVWGAAAATVAAQAIALVICALVFYRKFPAMHLVREDFKQMNLSMAWNMLTAGFSMGMMSSLISIGSLVLQTAINQLGSDYIIAQTAARKLTEVLMLPFVVFGITLTTYSGQNYGAHRYDRIRQGMKVGLIYTVSWCAVVLLVTYTICPYILRMITGDINPQIIDYADQYLRIDTILYFLVAIIFVLRHTLQGIGDKITPLISSGIEMGGKVILAMTLVPKLGYFGVILTEPIVWIVMIIPLIVKMAGHPVVKER